MKHVSKRILSAVLSVIMIMSIFTIIPITASAAENNGFTTMALISSKQSTLAPGVTEYKNSVYASDGKRINYYYAEADLSNENVGIHTSYKDAQCSVPGMAKMTVQAESLIALHSNPEDTANYIPYYAIVAGVNGDGYDTGSGRPSGPHYSNGVAGFGIVKAANSPWFALFEDGIALCGSNNADWDAAIAEHGAVKESIGGFQLVMKDGVEVPFGSSAAGSSYLNDGRYPRSFIGVTAENKIIMMAVDGNSAGGSAGSNYAESLEILKQAGCTYILCLDGGGSATYISRPEGKDKVEVTSTPSDGTERAVSNGIVIYSTTPPSDTFDHAVLSVSSDYVSPGSSVKVTAAGVSPAGTSADIPENAVLTATNGSIVDDTFVSDSTVGDAVITMTVDGVDVGSVVVHVVNPDSVAFTKTQLTVPYGESLRLQVVGKYGKNTVTMQNSDWVFSLADPSIGTIQNGVFTAAQSGTETTITVALAADDSVNATIPLKLGKGSEVIFDFEEGTAGADLNNWNIVAHAAGAQIPSTLDIVTPETGKVHSGNQALAFNYRQDEAIHGTEFWAGNALNWVGDKITLKDAVSVGFWLYVPEDALQLSVQPAVYYKKSDGSTAQIIDRTVDYDDDEVNNLEYSGWHYYKININVPEAYIMDNTAFAYKNRFFIKFYIVNIGAWANDETNYMGNFTYYIDDITVDYSEAVVDREEPIFSNMTYATSGMSDASALNGQTIRTNTVSFAASVQDNMAKDNATGLDGDTAKVYIDGVEVDCDYSNGIISLSDAVLTDGVHTIRMSICDNAGNYTETRRQIKVDTTAKTPSVRVQPKDSTLNYLQNHSVYWVDVVADTVEDIDTVKVKLDLDSMNDWELEYMDVLSGFTCDWYFETAAEKAENIVTFDFKRSGYLSADGTAVLASLPIRVWDYVASDDHVHKNAVEAWKCKYGCAPALSVDVDTELGIVKYNNGTEHTFSSADIRTYGVSYTYGLRIRDYDNSFYTSHCYHVHNAVAVPDVAATCTTSGYTGRTVCDVCNSPVNWGTIIPATGHSFELVDGVLKCDNCDELYNGEYEGKLYIDGVEASGWIDDSYYADGVKVTGVQPVDGYYYDFGDNGVCAGKVKYTGMFYDESVSAYRYAKIGELTGGWAMIDNDWHYFLRYTKVAATGTYTTGGVTYDFDETGKTYGAWNQEDGGIRYYYGPSYYVARYDDYETFVEIDGKTYNFDTDGYLTTGKRALQPAAFVTYKNVYDFGDDGVLVGKITTPGPIECADGMYLINEEGTVNKDAGLVKYNNDYYYVVFSGKLAVNATKGIAAAKTNGLLPAGSYSFGADGKMTTVVNGLGEDGYYRENGVIVTGGYGIIKQGDDYYFIVYSGTTAKNTTKYVNETLSHGLLPVGNYTFGADGKMVTTLNSVDAEGYYRENGEIKRNAYLVKVGDDYYFVGYSGKVITNKSKPINSGNSNGLLPDGTYIFGADGKMTTSLNGVDAEGYYRVNGEIKSNAYLVKVGDDYYYVGYSGKVITNKSKVINSGNSNGLLPNGTYTFGADGKMTTSLNGVDAEGYYRVNGEVKSNAYLVKVGSDYYFVGYSGKVITNKSKPINSGNSNGLLPDGTYTFGADGKMQNPPV